MAFRDPTAQSEPGSSRWVWAAFWLLGILGAIFSGARETAYVGVMFCVAGLLMMVFPLQVRLPRWWLILGAVVIGGGLFCFLPASALGEVPAWRVHLDSLGVVTGSKVVIQSPQALEMLGVYSATLIVGLWLAGQRATPSQIRFWALIFSLGVAVYAIVSELTKEIPFVVRTSGHFGFFPNRNHTGTYLAMGVVAGLGCLLQALRDKRVGVMILSVVSSSVCLWAVAGWSISRGGVLLTGLGSLLWLTILGPRYLGSHGRRAIILLALAIVGGFWIADTQVKERIAETSDRTIELMASKSSDDFEEKEASGVESLDFRMPIALDTFDLIGDFAVTGVGAGQFSSIMPQYRTRTIVVNNSKILHPESDWLWMAAELGLPSAFSLLALVGGAVFMSLRETFGGRDRALRTACLVAASLVAIHGFFDVPGHRIALAWSAAFLFSLSFRTRGDWQRRQPSNWPSRLAGALVVAIGAYFVAGVWFGGPVAAIEAPTLTYKKSIGLYKEAVPDLNDPFSMDIAKLVKVGDAARDSIQAAPLDYRGYALQGRVGLFFPERFPEVEKAFTIERALNPYWIQVPLVQGKEWMVVEPQRGVAAWKEAFARADAVDSLEAKAKARERLLRNLKSFSRKQPLIQKMVDEAAQP